MRKCKACGDPLVRRFEEKLQCFKKRSHCDRACGYVNRSTPISETKKCRHCNILLKRRPGDKPSKYLNRMFCNSKCQYAARVGKRRGYKVAGISLGGKEIALLTGNPVETIGVRVFRGLDLLTGLRVRKHKRVFK